MAFDQAFFVSADPDPRQPINRVIVCTFKSSADGEELRDSFATSALGSNPLDQGAILSGLKDILRKRMQSLNESRALAAALATLDKNAPLDLTLSADDQAAQITLDANRTFNAAVQAVRSVNMLAESGIIAADDPEIKEKTEQATAAREALKALTAEGADAAAVEK